MALADGAGRPFLIWDNVHGTRARLRNALTRRMARGRSEYHRSAGASVARPRPARTGCRRRECRGTASFTTSTASLAAVLHGMLHLVHAIRDRGALPDFNVLGAMIYYIDAFPERFHHPQGG